VNREVGLLLSAATVVVGIDLGYTALAVSERGGAVLAHDRSLLYVVGVAAASLLWAVAIARVRSSSIALVGGMVLGGAAGNLLAIALWPSLPGVPDPILAGGVAFNLADLSVAAGFAMLLPATLAFAFRNRERLFEPV
jgi:lipoprotein signal peptidase